MRNLKRTLSLALAAIMLVGMMVVSASAASYNNLTDKDEIVNKDAVSMLVSLGIIEGKPDGSYGPTENVDRAQMAKMLSVIMNKGVDNSALYQSVNSGLVDVNTNWAKGHINYCYTTGIIAGRGNGKFDPSATVTALEAAKMLLVAVGYDPAIEGFEGADWAINVSVRADEQGIFEGFTKDLSAPLNRDDAALLIYNALDVEMIQSYTTNNYPIAYSDHRTILADKYGVIKVQGVVVANEWASLASDDGDAALKEGKTTIYNGEGIFSTTGNTTVSKEDASLKTQTFNVSTPVDMLGKTVNLYIKKTTILADSTVYGDPVVSDVNTVVTTGETVLYSGAKDPQVDYDKLLGENGLTDKDAKYFWNYNSGKYIPTTTEKYGDKTANVKGATLTIIDNNGDGEVDYVLSVEKALADITSVNSKKETVTVRTLGTLDNKDVVGYEDMAKEDVVLYVQYGGRTYLEKPEVVTGEMEHFNVKGTEKYMTVGGEKYKADELETNARTEVVKFDVTECDKANGVQFETSYNFYLDDYGNVIAFEEVEAAAKNYALVLDSAFSTNMLNTSGQVKVLLPDGTTKTYELNWDNSVKSWKDENNSALDTTEEAAEALKTFLGTDDGGGVGKTYPAAGAAAGNLVAYSINADDKMTIDLPELTVGDVVDATKKPDYTSGTSGFFAAGQEMLSADISKGDVEIKTNATGVGDPTGTFGIDADTIVYYYNGKDGSVAVGYDNMAKLIDKNGVLAETGKKIIDAGTNTNGTANGEVKVSVVDLYKSDVANVVVLYTSQAKFGNEDYVFVMPEFDVYNDYFYYTVIHEDGTMEEVKSEENLRNDLKGTDGIVCTIDMDSKNLASFNTTPSRVAEGFVKVTSSRYVNVYTDATTNNAIQNPGKDNEWLDMTKLQSPVRLANKNDELIYDIDNTDVDDETATGTTFQDGQYGYVVYDEDNVVKAAFIVKSYLTEDPTGNNKPGKPSNDDLALKIITSGPNRGTFYFLNAEDATLMDMEDLLISSFEKLGYEVVKIHYTNGDISAVDVKRGSSESTFRVLDYTVTDEVQDVVVDTVGDTTVGPVAEDVKDTSTGLADGTLAGGLFNGITPQNGMKLTTLTITLPVDPSTTYRAVRQTNNALITCATEGGEDVPTAWKHGDSFVKAGAANVTPAGTAIEYSLLVCDDGEPITLEVFESSTGAFTVDSDHYTVKENGGSVATPSYTVTIDTTGVTFQ
ncbi:S-layer homology domain-containing protein [Flavonifractor plautii]|uniref:S-layer homology domain-containing protein n=7 Tax=Flavonifractor plautii TaxID=292800 RepID=UPI0019246EE1|nr:S-layer homology domain-containing protein [Flavonifractor plautii]